MSKEEVGLTAYCGLYCGDCIRYRSKAADLARELISELKNAEFGKYAKVKSHLMKQFQHFKDFIAVLEAIVELQCNNACRVGGGCPSFSCKIVECCQEKRFEGCWKCEEFEKCKEFEFLKPFHGDTPQQNSKKIREMGLEKWAEYRYKCYVWQQ
ncbi:DUF3795 domain-containing protein [Chloroflexota bacterium]